jgi:hypothetical protein
LRKKPGWDKMNLERTKLIDHSMSCIIPPIKACHIIHLLGKKIDGFAFALIAPL